MNELFKILGTVAVDNSGANDALDETTGKAEKSHGNISKAFSKIGEAAVAVGKTMAVGLGVAATAIGGIAKASLDSYADYEQLVGGVDTLFKDSSKKVQDYANKAYETAGMSANDYMETVTSFSASLLQSLDGDTDKAADKANQAIIDMSDNANKMGTSIESIQNAYQGFAKQNYTMLDNLKLGYGGTKEEMERLLEDATAISGVEYDIESYADVVDAIHIIQTQMGITGTTAKEASSTISGSMSSMKSAWTNLITGLGNEDADLSGLIDKFTESAETVMDNVLPRVEKILGGITNALPKLLSKISKKLPSTLKSFLPSLLKAATTLLKGVVQALPTLLKVLIEQVPYIVTELGAALMDALPILLDTVQDLLAQVWDFIMLDVLNTGISFEDAIDAIFNSDVFAAISSAFAKVKEAVTPVVEAFQNLIEKVTEGVDWSGMFSSAFSVMTDVISWAWETIGQPVLDGIVLAINWVADNWETITAVMGEAFAMYCDYAQTVWTNIGQPVWDMISWAIEWAVELFKKNMPAIKAFFAEAVAGIKDTWEKHLKPAFEAIGKFLNDVLKPAFEYVFETVIGPLVEGAFKHIGNLWTKTLKPVFDGICDFITGVFTLDFEKALNGIGGIISGAFSAVQSTIETPFRTAWTVISKIVEDMKKIFEFKFSMPDIKLPHFGITPKGWQLGDLLKGVIPKLGIEWYAKGGVLTEPTIFGMNGNNAMIGGEAGHEAIAPIDVLQKYVEESVAKNNAIFAGAINDGFDRLLDFLQAYIPELANMQVVMDSGAMVAELAPAMDARLGKMYIRSERGAW